MNYDMTKPCAECPFLAKNKKGYALKRLHQFASGEFPCHKTAEYHDESEDDEGNERQTGYLATKDSSHCAGALIFLEKRNQAHQMMRICERIGMYDRTKLDMKAPVL